MILTCPECATRFKINPDAIGANGRTVRCSQCSATWFVAAEPDVMDLQDSEDNALKPVAGAVSAMAASSALAAQGAHAHDDGNAEDANSDSSYESTSAHNEMRDKADRKKIRRRLFGVGMIWVTVLTILILAILAAYLFRAKIVEQFPGAAPIYKSFGIEANTSGLDIIDVEFRNGEQNGTPTLFVNGKVKNFDGRTRDVALVRLSFKNADGEVISSWVVQPSQASLESGETLDFTTQYPNPPVDAKSLASSFVDEVSVQEGSVPMASQ